MGSSCFKNKEVDMENKNELVLKKELSKDTKYKDIKIPSNNNTSESRPLIDNSTD